MIYAPVIIPTVNRYKHFKECLESLSRCTWADKTDVFIAVDYPGKEEHWEGYRLIKDYLLNRGDLGFKSLNVTYRETNYFFSGKGNAASLVKEVYKKYDRIIFSEDDNVFSPNFLVYINKGLEKYEHDESVFAINGYIPPLNIKYTDNNFIRQNVDFYAWGYGMWRSKRNDKNTFFRNSGFYHSLNFKNIRKLYRNGRYRLLLYFQLVGEKTYRMTDNNYSVYMAINNLDVVMPTLSLVRNQGWDDSGIHCPSSNKLLADEIQNQNISNETSFEYSGSGMEFYDYNKIIFSKNRERPHVSVFDLLIRIIKTLIKRTVFLLRR